MLSRLKALMLLDECNGRDIWSLEHCRQRGVPEDWLEELSDCFESGFDDDRHTIYVGDRLVNQFHGLRGSDLAVKLGEFLGVDVQSLTSVAPSGPALVRMIRDAVQDD